jgi:hypothetical protein
MSIAEEFYNEKSLEERARARSIAVEEFIHGEVEYVAFTFRDKSKLTFGNNGYIGCEVPAQ